MPLQTKNEVLLRIKELQSTFSASEKKVAQYILENPDSTIHLSIALLAGGAGVSEPTVIRFCRKLDFSGYQDLKIALAKGSGATADTLKIIHEEVSPADSIHELSRKVINSHILALQHTLSHIHYDVLTQVCDRIAASGRIDFYGLGGSGTIAIDTENKFLRTSLNTSACIDAHIQLMRASLMNENDTIVIISNTGTTEHFMNVIQTAHEKNAKVILLTSFKNSPLGKISDYVLEIRATETSYKQEPSSARIAMLGIMDIIVTNIAFRNPNHYIQNIYDTRKALSTEKNVRLF